MKKYFVKALTIRYRQCFNVELLDIQNTIDYETNGHVTGNDQTVLFLR